MKRSKNLRETATKEQGIFAPDGSIPAHEMLGDIFSDMGQPEQALAEYEAKLKLSPIVDPETAALVVALEHAYISDGISLRCCQRGRCQHECHPRSLDRPFHKPTSSVEVAQYATGKSDAQTRWCG